MLSLSDGKYGFLVSIAGAGVVIGALVNTVFVKKLAVFILIGGGSLFLSAGYILYAISDDFFGAGIGFFILSFALAFANTGFYTFYQNNIPVEMMGRIGSIYGLIESLLVILFTILFGVVAQVVSIQFAVILGTLVMLVISVTLLLCNVLPSKRKYYLTDEGLFR